ncbi:TRAP transporter small permease [Clostridium sp. AM58-1XD]|uniref:TRAP transporter small permease n=1 Tax=Clostridium sp. AM58-1XD TaxID=2292307 RepID=UPI000E4C4D92|nr:TRAP transporter small permease [Clostridium sp. AM58-1XD]RGY97631.1 TRAP transporter small permease [Clostridium sp. AM58-1XD]
MKAVNKALDFIEIYVNGILLLGMCFIIFLQVIFRGLGMPLVWTEEIARFFFVWIIYISTSKAIMQKRHLSIDIMPLLLKKKGNLILQLVSDLIGLLFFCIVFYYGMHVIQSFINKPQFSQATHTNMILGYMAPYFGAAISAIRYVQDLILTGKELAGSAGKEANV